MPIRVTCQCGQSLSVPDEMAGKSGKCPKCKNVLKIPSGSAATSSAGTSTPKPAASKPTAKSPPIPSKLAGMFDEVGLVTKTGQFCPSCDAAIAPNSIICVSCGFHLSEGKQVEGHKSTEKKIFGNKQLNEAVEMMEREQDTETRLMGTGFPWWMLLSILVGVIVFIGGLAIKMDASTSGQVSTNPTLARIQAATYLTVMAASFGLAMVMVATFAHLAILVTAFKESIKQGFLCLLVPLYILYYMFSRLFAKHLLSTVIIFFSTLILGSLALAYGLPKI